MKKILIIEDELAYVRLLRNKLEPHYKVLDAGDGKTGLETALREKPDLTLLDIRMPVMDGMTMLRELRKDKKYGAEAKVIILTNLEASDQIVSQVTTDLPTYYFVKSDLTLDELLAKVQKLIG